MAVDPLAAINFGIKISESWLKPILNSLKKDLDINLEKLICSFSDYLDRNHTKHSYLQTIVFPNQQVLLKDLYIPLGVIANDDKKTEFLLTDYLNEFLPAYRNVLIVDTAGMGKSTLLKFLFIRAIEKNVGIPILIELRKLSKEKKIIDFIYSELNSLKNVVNKDFISHLIEKGNFIFFLDGYDEIPSEHREFVTLDIEDFKTKANKNIFLLSSREEQGLAAFSEFQRFNIRPLHLEEAHELIKKYDRNKNLATLLINKLNEPDYAQVKEFLTNPLLVSLLYKSFEFKPTVPLKKPIFYRQVYEALFENHDFSKVGEYNRKKKSSLDIDQFHSVLRALGFLTYKEGRTEFISDEFLTLIDKAKNMCSGLVFSNSDFKNDLVNQVPLIINDGNFYRWSHKSIQEYFAASYICLDSKEKESEILLSILRSEKIDSYMSMFTLCFDIDYKKFSQVVLLKLAKEFIDYFDSSYLNLPTIDKHQIQKRKEICAFKDIVFLNKNQAKSQLIGDSPGRVLHELLEESVRKENGRSVYGSTITHLSPVSIGVGRQRLFNFLQFLASKDQVQFIEFIPIETIQEDKELDESIFTTEEICIYLNDSKDNTLNNKENFETVNNYLERFGEWKFDYPKAKATIKKIEKEIANEANADFNF